MYESPEYVQVDFIWLFPHVIFFLFYFSFGLLSFWLLCIPSVPKRLSYPPRIFLLKNVCKFKSFGLSISLDSYILFTWFTSSVSVVWTSIFTMAFSSMYKSPEYVLVDFYWTTSSSSQRSRQRISTWEEAVQVDGKCTGRHREVSFPRKWKPLLQSCIWARLCLSSRSPKRSTGEAAIHHRCIHRWNISLTCILMNSQNPPLNY